MNTDEFNAYGVLFRELAVWNSRQVRGFVALEGRIVVLDINADPESPFYGALGQKYAKRWVIYIDDKLVTRSHGADRPPAMSRYSTARQAAESAMRRLRAADIADHQAKQDFYLGTESGGTDK